MRNILTRTIDFLSSMALAIPSGQDARTRNIAREVTCSPARSAVGGLTLHSRTSRILDSMASISSAE